MVDDQQARAPTVCRSSQLLAHPLPNFQRHIPSCLSQATAALRTTYQVLGGCATDRSHCLCVH